MQGRATKLPNLLLLRTFYHLISVYEWGWSISLDPDGTATMANPSGTKGYRSHTPPAMDA